MNCQVTLIHKLASFLTRIGIILPKLYFFAKSFLKKIKIHMMLILKKRSMISDSELWLIFLYLEHKGLVLVFSVPQSIQKVKTANFRKA